MDKEEIDQEMAAKGLTAAHVTKEWVDSRIKDARFHKFPGTTMTVCCLVLVNGYTVTGESACVSPENFDEQLGRKIAFDKARDKIWALEGYLMREKLAASTT